MELDFAGWQNLINNIGDATFILGRNGDVLFINDAVVQLLGYSAGEAMRMNTYTLVRTRQMDTHILRRVLETKRPVTACQKYIRKDGSETPYMMVTQSPVLDESGEVKYSVGIIRNMERLYQVYRNCVRDSEGVRLPAVRRDDTADFIYRSPNMGQLVDAVRGVASSGAVILIQGESGTGKEVLANFIHRHSGRGGRELVAVNCAALPEQLLEAELFGYEKGAFTGAKVGGKPGLAELADGGTLFLDEIDSLPPALQGKLLRLIETHQVRRVGGVTSRVVDFRLLAATNADLKERIRQKSFRPDLYYRLSVLPFTLPPLRERQEDIRPLCEHFLAHYEWKYGRKKSFSQELYRKLEGYDWPGNVRELKNVIERVVLMTDAGATEISDISDELFGAEMSPPEVIAAAETPQPAGEAGYPAEPGKTLRETVAAYELWLIRRSVERYGSLSKAAAALGSSKATLSRKLREGRFKD